VEGSSCPRLRCTAPASCAPGPLRGITFRKSSYSGANGGNCVETASGDEAVLVRDTTDRAGTVLSVPHSAWQAFLGTLTG
jgi:hypothetical protein